MSPGEKQVLELVRLLLGEKEIVVLDECAGQLDETLGAVMAQAFSKFLKVV